MAPASACASSPTTAAPPRHRARRAAVQPPRRCSVTGGLRTGRLRIACRCRAAPSASGAFAGGEGCEGIHNWDWNRWNRHFSEVDQAESELSVLKFQLEEAVENEDFAEAAILTKVVAETTSKDSVAMVMSELKNAIEEQRYRDASKLSQIGRTGLVGWWFGYAKNSGDTSGRIVRITPSVGRYVARSYSPRQLLTESSGTPLFEIFLLKDDEGAYVVKAVFLQAAKGSSSAKSSSSSAPNSDLAKVDSEDSSIENLNSTSEASSIKSGQINDDTVGDNADSTDPIVVENQNVTDKGGAPIAKGTGVEGLKNIFKYFKARIPDFEVQVSSRSDDSNVESESSEELAQNDKDKGACSKNPDDEPNASEVQQEALPVDESLDSTAERDSTAIKLFIGGVMHNKEETSSRSYVRVPAEIKSTGKDSFELFIPGKDSGQDLEELKAAKMKVAAIAAKLASDLMPPEVAKAFLNAGSGTANVPKDMQDLLKLAVNKFYRRDTLTDTTVFHRIMTGNSDLDPFDGLYVGAFGPHGPEVVQLRRKYGHWNASDDMNSKIEFFEYVEAVKLTGDQNVPAGQVTFRAKITKGSRLSNRGNYPEEFGVVASYQGQGRIADPDFKNPRWVDGELLQLSGKGGLPHLRGANLGFLYSIPEQSFLVLFNRLKLPE